MKKRNFRALLEARWAEGKLLCIGLDPDIKKIPAHLRAGDTTDADVMVHFCCRIVDATCHLVLAYKPNLAFFARYGARGLEGLRQLVAHINAVAPGVPVILDVKNGDIGNSMAGYVDFALVEIGADAMTASPYLGQDASQPLLDRVDNGAIFLCKTSNPGGGEFQDMEIMLGRIEFRSVEQFFGHELDRMAVPLYQYVAYRVAKYWNAQDNCALVVGATYPNELRAVRDIVGDMPILIPGIGTQGGDEEATIVAGRDSRGRGIIVNVGGAILFASGGEDFVDAALAKAEYYSTRFLNFANA